MTASKKIVYKIVLAFFLIFNYNLFFIENQELFGKIFFIVLLLFLGFDLLAFIFNNIKRKAVKAK